MLIQFDILESEDKLAKLITQFITSGYPLTPFRIRKLAYQYAEANKFQGFSVKYKIAGKSWFRGFKLRYPQFRVKVAKNISIFRALGANRYSLDIFFGMYKRIIAEKKLENPNQIWNIDESGMGTLPKEKDVFSLRGLPALQVVSDEKSKLFTVVSYISAGGMYCPPMIVLNGSRVQPQWREWAPAHWMIRCSDSGYINMKLFLEYGKFFLDWLKTQPIQGPFLILMDLHKSHLYNAPFLTAMKDNDVSVCSFPPHCTQAIQPLDDVPFAQLKKLWNNFLSVHNENGCSKALTVREFLTTLPAIWDTALSRPCIVSGWYNTGLYPVNRKAEKLCRLISKCNSLMIEFCSNSAFVR